MLVFAQLVTYVKVKEFYVTTFAFVFTMLYLMPNRNRSQKFLGLMLMLILLVIQELVLSGPCLFLP